MNNIDFIELSRECVSRKKGSYENDEHNSYVSTLFVAIDENDEVICSYDSQILESAYECILIHCTSVLAVTNHYKSYSIEYIDQKGFNNQDILKNDCYMRIHWVGSWANELLSLYHGENELYTCRPPFEGHMQRLWTSYCNIRGVRNHDEILDNLKAELVSKSKRVKELENQIAQYKSIISKFNEKVNEIGE